MSTLDVVQQSSNPFRGVAQQPQRRVARAAQQSAYVKGLVAVVHVEEVVGCPRTSGRSSTRSTHPTLGSKHFSVLLQSKSVGTPEVVCPAVDLAPVTSVLSQRRRVVDPVLRFVLGLADGTDQTIRPLDESNLGLATATPSRHGLSVDITDSVLGDDALGALPATATSCILFDGDLAAPAALSTSVAHVDFGQDVTIFPLPGGMAPDVSDRTSLDPPTLSGGLGGNAGTTSAPAVTAAVGNSACGSASTHSISFHGQKGITC
jgi:hypothetical protein